MRACAGPEPGSSMPHVARSVCRARRIGDANGNAAQTDGLARQVRQRMNRLGKPEHRARFCFFSKKKSLAGMRRFPITLEIQIRMGFKRSAPKPHAPKTLLQPPSLADVKRQPHPLESPPHNVPPCSPISRRLRHHTPANHRICRPIRITAHLGAAPCALVPPHL